MSKTNGHDPTETTEGSELLSVAGGLGECELTFDGGECRIQVRAPRLEGEDFEWTLAYRDGMKAWREMFDRVHEARLEEIRAEQGGRVGPASAGFMQEGASEARNQTLAGGIGARPV